jgi:putative FmdB family regulatory protein
MVERAPARFLCHPLSNCGSPEHAIAAQVLDLQATIPHCGNFRGVASMPIYAFRCEACGHSFDRLQKLSDPDPAECPECGKPAVKRQVTAPAFRLAGSGWYETDFKSDKDKKRNLAGDDAPKKKEDSGGGKPEPSTSKAAGSDAAKPAASASSPADGSAAG